MVRVAVALPLALALLLPLPTLAAPPRSLSLAQRVEARRAIERVLWQHRIWPEGSPSQKPPLEAWLPAGTLEREVEDDLRKSDALARRWGQPIRREALQAELDRMVRDTQAPDLLREMLDALDGDPLLAAEVLARHALADRLARSAFAYDGRIHGEIHARAASARSRAADLRGLVGAADRVTVVRYERARTDTGPAHDLGPVLLERLDEEAWRLQAEPLRGRRLGEMGPLEEDAHAFTVSAVTAIDDDAVTRTTAIWTKRSFDGWWQEARLGFLAETPATAEGFTLGQLAPPENPCVNDSWYPLKRAVPSARMQPATVWTGVEMIVWGGGPSGVDALGTGGRYRPDIDAWTEMTSVGAPSPRRRASAVWTGTEMIVWGGDDGDPTSNYNYFSTGGRYNPTLDAWTPTATAGAPTARTLASAVWTGTRMIVWGGFNTTLGYFNTGAVYDPVANTWTPTPTAGAPSPRYLHTANWLNSSEMVVWGGYNGGYLGDGARYNPATNAWSPMASAGAPSARYFHTAVNFAGGLLIWGGQGFGYANLNTGAVYSADTWNPVPTTGAPSGRLQHSAVVADHPSMVAHQRMSIFGGITTFEGHFPTDVEGGAVFRQETWDWAPMATAGAPSGRHFHAAVGTGTTMVIWGGAIINVAQGDGRRYDPFADVWSGVSGSGTPGPSPGARTRHSLTWTGTEAVVWGGLDALGGFAPGGSAYSPVTDSWTAMPDAGGPGPRYWHTALWNGTVLIVWGGETPGGTVNTGALWNASGWIQPTLAAGAPSARRRHTAVWAPGSGMIVWGGEVNFGNPVFNDGGIYFYHPLFGESWATPPAAPVGGRLHHTATWTGSQMVVFGGASTSQIFGDGAAYRPMTNAWTLLPTTGAPAPRYLHTAVSTPDDVLVWGGFGNGTNHADGARYVPSQNLWKPLAPSGLAGRRQLEATWTGREMLVWGGLGATGIPFANGARYNAGFDGWVPMLAWGGPSARYDYRSAQAGDEMLVWGGANNTDSGGRYCASCAVLYDFETAKDLTFSSPTTMAWTPNVGVTSYTVYRGTIAPGPLNYHGCLQTGLTSPAATDAAVPAPGLAFYYLVGAENGCSQTHLGRGLGGALRVRPPCF